MEPFMSIPDRITESRKLIGLCVALLAVLLTMVTFIICSAFLGTPWAPFNDMLQWVATIAGVHQTAQATSDVVKWRASGQAGYNLQTQNTPVINSTVTRTNRPIIPGL
jgi:hypothetical protein